MGIRVWRQRLHNRRRRRCTPPKDSVIDAGWVKTPVLDPNLGPRENLGGYKAIALTNLRGFSRAKNLRLQIFRGESTMPKDRIIGPLGGASIDRVAGMIDGKPALAQYRLSYLTVGRKVHAETLLRALKRPINANQKVRGRTYDYAMKVTMLVTGFLTENGPRKSVKNTYYLVFNEGKERDPELALATGFP